MVLKKNKGSMRSREPLNLLAYAQAFTGEVLSGTTSSWRVSITAANYNPPKLDAYKFNIAKSSYDSESHSWESDRNYSGKCGHFVALQSNILIGKHNISVAIDDIIIPVTLTCNCTLKVLLLVRLFISYFCIRMLLMRH
jgi:hypothetical protein